MINNLPESFEFSATLFAEDLCFWDVGTSIEEFNKQIQNSLNKIKVWCNKNRITISNTKSTAILFTKTGKNNEIALSFNNIRNSETRKQIKYLGVIFKKMDSIMLYNDENDSTMKMYSCKINARQMFERS